MMPLMKKAQPWVPRAPMLRDGRSTPRSFSATRVLMLVISSRRLTDVVEVISVLMIYRRKKSQKSQSLLLRKRNGMLQRKRLRSLKRLLDLSSSVSQLPQSNLLDPSQDLVISNRDYLLCQSSVQQRRRVWLVRIQLKVRRPLKEQPWNQSDLDLCHEHLLWQAQVFQLSQCVPLLQDHRLRRHESSMQAMWSRPQSDRALTSATFRIRVCLKRS